MLNDKNEANIVIIRGKNIACVKKFCLKGQEYKNKSTCSKNIGRV